MEKDERIIDKSIGRKRSTEFVSAPRPQRTTNRIAESERKKECQNKELNLSLQFVAFFCLWLFWLSTAFIVIWRETALEERNCGYEYRLLIYSIVFGAMPLVLVVIALIFLKRAKPVTKLGYVHRIYYRVVQVVGILTSEVLLFYSALLAMSFYTG